MEQLYHLLEQQEKLFVASIEDLNQTIGQVREKYSTQVSRDIALLDELIGELEAKQYQPEWELMQDIGVTLHRYREVPSCSLGYPAGSSGGGIPRREMLPTLGL